MKEIVDSKIRHRSFGEIADDIIGFFSPMTAVKRRAARMAYDIQRRRNKRAGWFSSYKGASKNRLRANWVPGGNSADQDILPELADLRERSRDLARNDGTAAGILSTINVNVIGRGIKPQSRMDAGILGLDQEKVDMLQDQMENIWDEWTSQADAGERLDFYEIQAMVDRQVLENGEIFLVPIMKDSLFRKLKTTYQIIEADRVSTPSDLNANKSIRSGIELGKYGEPIAYYIKKSHPGDTSVGKAGYKRNDSSSYMRIPAIDGDTGKKKVYHMYCPTRPDQTRGVPFFAPVLTYFKDLADYFEAELVTARIAACFSIFITKDAAYEAAVADTASTNSAGQRIKEMEPGLFEYLLPGEKIESFSPNRPGGSFEPFVNRILRLISTALGLPYELVAKDFTQTNYSSARAALIEAIKYFIVRQAWMTRKLCQPVWEEVMEEAFLRGMFKAPDFYKKKRQYLKAVWIAPGSQWVDPLKEVQAHKEAMNGNIATLADVCAAQGKDWEEVMEQRARECKYQKELEDKFEIKLGANTPEKQPEPEEKKENQDEEDANENSEKKYQACEGETFTTNL